MPVPKKCADDDGCQAGVGRSNRKYGVIVVVINIVEAVVAAGGGEAPRTRSSSMALLINFCFGTKFSLLVGFA